MVNTIHMFAFTNTTLTKQRKGRGKLKDAAEDHHSHSRLSLRKQLVVIEGQVSNAC